MKKNNGKTLCIIIYVLTVIVGAAEVIFSIGLPGAVPEAAA